MKVRVRMGCFPFYMELEGVRGVIVGGGVVAFRKAEKLLPFGPALSVIAPEMDERFFRLEKDWDRTSGRVRRLHSYSAAQRRKIWRMRPS